MNPIIFLSMILCALSFATSEILVCQGGSQNIDQVRIEKVGRSINIRFIADNYGHPQFVDPTTKEAHSAAGRIATDLAIPYGIMAEEVLVQVFEEDCTFRENPLEISCQTPGAFGKVKIYKGGSLSFRILDFSMEAGPQGRSNIVTATKEVFNFRIETAKQKSEGKAFVFYTFDGTGNHHLCGVPVKK